MARVLGRCRNHYRQVMPEHWRFMVRSARIQMHQAVMDCRELDKLRAGHGLPPLFVDAFTEYDHADALAGIHCRAYTELRELAKGKKPFHSSNGKEDPGKFEWKFTLERFRESLRDGRSVEQVLERFSDRISSLAGQGQAGFFEDLGDLLRKHRRTPFQRSLTGWIVRAWLPLCLWECAPDGQEAFQRFRHAVELMQSPLMGADPDKFYHQFVEAWRNTRSKKMKLKAKT